MKNNMVSIKRYVIKMSIDIYSFLMLFHLVCFVQLEIADKRIFYFQIVIQRNKNFISDTIF